MSSVAFILGDVQTGKLKSINKQLETINAVLEDNEIIDLTVPAIKGTLYLEKGLENLKTLKRNIRFLSICFFLKTKLGKQFFLDYKEIFKNLTKEQIIKSIEFANETFKFRPNEQIKDALLSTTTTFKEKYDCLNFLKEYDLV